MSFHTQGKQRLDELMKTEVGQNAIYNSMESANRYIQTVKGVPLEEQRPLADQPTFWSMVRGHVRMNPDMHIFYALVQVLNDHTSFERIEQTRHE